ncbi:hypothetical protein e57899_A0A2N1MX19_9GLOM [Rhizophagus irregularis DAOM 181602=DAOM 197198]|nr:hypothetical protein e57899_A0A2N1MX19_9GLOM [Rhizophagus irregularis DAOM 181602=DAOM 197198]
MREERERKKKGKGKERKKKERENKEREREGKRKRDINLVCFHFPYQIMVETSNQSRTSLQNNLFTPLKDLLAAKLDSAAELWSNVLLLCLRISLFIDRQLNYT